MSPHSARRGLAPERLVLLLRRSFQQPGVSHENRQPKDDVALAVEEMRCTFISTTGTQFVNPCGNFSDTSNLRLVKSKDL